MISSDSQTIPARQRVFVYPPSDSTPIEQTVQQLTIDSNFVFIFYTQNTIEELDEFNAPLYRLQAPHGAEFLQTFLTLRNYCSRFNKSLLLLPSNTAKSTAARLNQFCRQQGAKPLLDWILQAAPSDSDLALATVNAKIPEEVLHLNGTGFELLSQLAELCSSNPNVLMYLELKAKSTPSLIRWNLEISSLMHMAYLKRTNAVQSPLCKLAIRKTFKRMHFLLSQLAEIPPMSMYISSVEELTDALLLRLPNLNYLNCEVLIKKIQELIKQTTSLDNSEQIPAFVHELVHLLEGISTETESSSKDVGVLADFLN